MEGCPGGCPCENWDCSDTVSHRLLSLLVIIVYPSATLTKAMISTDAKMALLKSLKNVSYRVPEFHHASWLVLLIMKMD